MGELHPPIVHFAIALTMVGVFFDLVGFILNRDSLKKAGFGVSLLVLQLSGLLCFQGKLLRKLWNISLKS